MALQMPVVTPDQRRHAVTRSPVVIPKKKLLARSIGLDPDIWDELDEVANYETVVHRELKSLDQESEVSRNEVVGSFLRWALDTWWQARGGRPTSERERAEKLRADVERRKKEDKQG